MEDARFVIIKGFVDGRDDKLVAFYGAFLGVASPYEVRYLKAFFSPIPIDRNIQWAQLLSLLRAEGGGTLRCGAPPFRGPPGEFSHRE